ncbi:hypothetical protein [Paraburkholderia unamae]|uniref:hypothetical protein n=1 Tax=Paraburkholderia unamae TaxID=219649 RepID=UPI0011BF19D5|nr:hypothetical protein [Paraburkholderia unamae]
MSKGVQGAVEAEHLCLVGLCGDNGKLCAAVAQLDATNARSLVDAVIPQAIGLVSLLPLDSGTATGIKLAPWATVLVPCGTVFNVKGLSLGGSRPAYAPLFLSAAQVGALHAFEPPKGANLAYYQRSCADLARLVIVANGRDAWFGYPRLDPRRIHRPGEMLHLLEQGYRVFDTAAWPGGLDLDDHSMELVVSPLGVKAVASLPV